MQYLKIFVRPFPPDTRRESLPFRLLMRLLPLANPDFDRQIPLVCTWLLEFERPEEPPVREIGLDGAGEVIAKMPHGQNYGYWTDNHLNYQDFITSFPNETIHATSFEHYWRRLPE